MEVAATVILSAGIRAVLARTFARSFYRNAVNNGLVVGECYTTAIVEGDRIALQLDESAVRVDNVSRGGVVSGAPMPGIMRRILEAGGLVGYLRGGGQFE
jgi:3-isopropylmalate/(R)-2-methylmalate dehydratase small subunit